MTFDLDAYTINASCTIRQALKKLNALSGSAMTLFVINEADHRLAGSLTDGDIRRAIINGATLDSAVIVAAHVSPATVNLSNSDNIDALRAMRRRGLTLIPVVDNDGVMLSILNLQVTPTQLPLSAILMAGGKGERLRPLTLDTPKPLLEIEGKPIIDYNLEALCRCGIKDIYVTVNYLAQKIVDHLQAFSLPGVNISTIREPAALGTIGSAAMAPLPETGNTLVMNSDLLTTISFEDMYLRHRDTNADVTIAVIPYQISVPYAILDINGDNVTAINEKPSYSHFANAGIYIFNNMLLRSLPTGRPTDATDLIQYAIDNNLKVTYHPVNGSWIDIGTPADFAQAKALMKHHNNFKRQS